LTSAAQEKLDLFDGVMACREVGMRTAKESVKRLKAKYSRSVPMLSPSSDLKISSSKYKKLQNKLRKLDDMMRANPLYHKCVHHTSSIFGGQKQCRHCHQQYLARNLHPSSLLRLVASAAMRKGQQNCSTTCTLNMSARYKRRSLQM
jgi:tRNA G26 N,N-dimethylase Trm1